MNCEICDKEFSFTWTDTHGVGVCLKCGTPYTIIHYDDDKSRVDKPPTIALESSGIELAKRYWIEKSQRVFPGVYDMGFLGGRRTTYSGATHTDIESFRNWYDDQPENIKEQA